MYHHFVTPLFIYVQVLKKNLLINFKAFVLNTQFSLYSRIYYKYNHNNHYKKDFVQKSQIFYFFLSIFFVCHARISSGMIVQLKCFLFGLYQTDKNDFKNVLYYFVLSTLWIFLLFLLNSLKVSSGMLKIPSKSFSVSGITWRN